MMKTEIKNSRMAWIPIVLIVLGVLGRDLYGVSVNKFIFVGLAAVAFAMTSKYGIYEMIALLIPFFVGLPGSYIACIALLFVLFKSGGKICQDSFGFGCCAIILVIELISALRGYGFSIVDYVTFAGAFLLTFMFLFDKDTEYNYWNIARNFVFGLLAAVVDIVGQMLKYYSWTKFLTLGVRIGDANNIIGKEATGMTVSYNSNVLGMYCAVCILICLISFTRYKKKWTILAGFVLLLIGIMTQSRAFIVILFLGLLMYFITGNDNPSTIVKKIFALAVSFVIGIYLVMRFIPDYFEGFVSRFQESDILNGRGSITSLYWERFWSSIDKIPFGSGLQNYAAKYNMTMSAHMGFEEVLVTWGIIGLILVLVMLLQAVKVINIRHFAEYERLIPFVAYILGLQSGQFFSNTTTFMSFIAWLAFARVTEASMNDENRIELTES